MNCPIFGEAYMAMQKTEIPMCYLCGPYDPNSGRHMANRYEQLISTPKVYLLNDNIGHWPQLEAPSQLLEFYNAFLRENKNYAIDNL